MSETKHRRYRWTEAGMCKAHRNTPTAYVEEVEFLNALAQARAEGFREGVEKAAILLSEQPIPRDMDTKDLSDWCDRIRALATEGPSE